MSTSYIQSRPEHTQHVDEVSRECKQSPADKPVNLPLVLCIFSALLRLPLQFFRQYIAERSVNRASFNTEIKETKSFQQEKLATKPAHDTSRPLILTFHFADHEIRKALDYTTFARWNSISAVISALKEDGMLIQCLWDRVENMAIRSGDWDARVRPGWEVDVFCSDGEYYDDSTSFYDESDDEKLDSGSSIDVHDYEVEKLCMKQWWFKRWRTKVEQEMRLNGVAVAEPSWSALMLGVLSMVLFLGGVVMFCLA